MKTWHILTILAVLAALPVSAQPTFTEATANSTRVYSPAFDGINTGDTDASGYLKPVWMQRTPIDNLRSATSEAKFLAKYYVPASQGVIETQPVNVEGFTRLVLQTLSVNSATFTPLSGHQLISATDSPSGIFVTDGAANCTITPQASALPISTSAPYFTGLITSASSHATWSDAANWLVGPGILRTITDTYGVGPTTMHTIHLYDIHGLRMANVKLSGNSATQVVILGAYGD